MSSPLQIAIIPKHHIIPANHNFSVISNSNLIAVAFVVKDGLREIELKLGEMTDAEREIILKGCLINYYRG